MMYNLNNVLKKLVSLGVSMQLSRYRIRVSPDLKSFTNLTKGLIYLLLNVFEKKYFIFITGIPYCLMPDADDHIVYNKSASLPYIKKIYCFDCKYFAICPGWPDNKIDKISGFHPIPNLPKEIVLEVTYNCNQNCILCFSRKRTKEISLSRVKAIIKECKKLGIKAIRFSGGEPILYKQLKPALLFAKQNGLYTLLNTNATILGKNIYYIKNTVDNVLVSLQGYNNETEIHLTKTNINLKEKLKNIFILRRYIPTLRVGTIISRTLINEWPRYLHLINKMSVDSWELYRPMSDDKNPEFNIDRNDLNKIINLINESKASHTEIKVANPVPFCISKNIGLNSKILLGANFDDGHSRIVFDSTGYFKPSYSIRKRLGDTIEDSWNNNFLKRMRALDFLPKKCQKCFYLKWCKGGSRYWARINKGSYFDIDPLATED